MKKYNYMLPLALIGALANSPVLAAPLDQDMPTNADRDMTMPDMQPSDMKMPPAHADQDSASMRTAPKENSTKEFDPKDAEPPQAAIPQGVGPKDMGASAPDTNGIVMDEPAPPPPPPVSEQDICTTKECAEDLKASGPNTEE